jgi:hypothetical protein
MKSKRLRDKAPWPCLGACLCILVLTAGFEEKTSAQASPVPSTSAGQLGISPEEPVPPPQPIIIKSPPPSATNSSPKANQNTSPKADRDASPNSNQNVSQDADAKGGQDAQAAKAELPPIPDPDPNNPIAVQSASLLKMAYELKSEVDKTTKDTLSVTVVRRAAEIEQLARKMRSK